MPHHCFQPALIDARLVLPSYIIFYYVNHHFPFSIQLRRCYERAYRCGFGVCRSAIGCLWNGCLALEDCCSRRKRCFRRHCPFVKDMIALYIVSFLVVAPVLVMNFRHTGLDFLKYKNVTTENERMLTENDRRYNESLLLLKKFEDMQQKELNIDSKISSSPLDESRQQRAQSSFRNGTKTGLAITVITVSRSIEDEEPHYLIQVVAAFLRLLHENRRLLSSYDIHLSICNVDSTPHLHKDVKTLPEWIPVYTRYENRNKKKEYVEKPILNKEKDDYTYCLDKALEKNISHVLLVEDDAFPRNELFIVLDNLIFSSAKRFENASNDVTYYKLYHPERLLGYISLELERIPELLSLSALLSVALLLIYERWRKKMSTSPLVIWIVLYIYCSLLLLAIGRVNIMEFRRISRHLYQLTPSPSCCTPAMLFTREGGKRISNYLKTVIDRAKFAKDIAIDEFRKKNKLVTRFIQPNLFKHIGHVSSLRLKLLDPFIV